MADPARRWVVLDVGETIIGETRMWQAWADALGIPPMTFMSVFGAIVARGQGYPDLPTYFDVDDWERHRPAVHAVIGSFRREDLYPDAVPAIERLRAMGLGVAVIGNQPARRHAELAALGVRPDVMAMSESLGAAKPDLAFFERSLERLGQPARADVAYVGDRIDNDVLPASAAGLRAIWLRRGPWGIVPTEDPPEAALIVHSLSELVERVDEAWA